MINPWLIIFYLLLTHAIMYDYLFMISGMNLGFSPVRNADGSQSLWVSEPYHNPSLFPSEADSGAAYLWEGGILFPKGITSNVKESSTICVESNVGKSLTAYAATMLDFNGNGVADLLLTAPRDHSLVEYGGSVNIILDIFA